MKKLISLFTCVLSLSLFSQDQLKTIDSIINSKIGENDPGLMVGIVKDGQIIYEKYRGLANLEHQVNITKKTRSNIASTAKQFTALIILKLSLEGKLNLEDDIRKYMPSLYTKVDDPIKIRHLLNHSSGIRDYVDLMSLQNKIWWKQVGLDNDDIIMLLEKQEELMFKPGIKYAYSNSNYNILAKIIEKVSDEKFTDYTKTFFKELGMNKTAFVNRYMGVIPNRADPYSDWGYGEWFHSPTVTKTAGEGFLYTTLKDQLVYELLVQNAKKNNNDLLIKSQKPIPNSEIKTYGFGLKLENRLNRNAVHHDGVTHSYHSQIIRFPDDVLTIFIMSNNGNIRSDQIADEIASVLLPKIEKEDAYDKRYFEALKNGSKTQIIGQYTYPNEGTLVRIVEEEGKTYWKEGNYYKLEMINQGINTFHFANNPKLKVAFYKNEMIEYYPSKKTMIYKRSNDLSPSFIDLEGFVGTYYSDELEMNFTLELTNHKSLIASFSNRKGELDVEVLNRNNLLAGDFVLKIKRDAFDRATDILVTSSKRAKNNRFRKKTNLKFHPKIKTENGTIQVTTIQSKNNNSSDILLTKNYPNGNEIWFKKFGGSGWDKASSILSTEDGYLIVGSTSSYGNGNYDIFVIQTDYEGRTLWQNTYGGFGNEYGYSAEKTEIGYLIKGSKQKCSSNTDVFNRTCITNVWYVTIDKKGKVISSKILEEIIE